MPVNESVILDLSIESGSYIRYNVSWGDGQYDEFDLSQKENPEARKTSHSYKHSGNFTITATVSNNNHEDDKNFTVAVMDCTIPLVRFSSGNNKGEAIEISSQSQYMFRAFYQFANPTCKESAKQYLTGKWKVHIDSTGVFKDDTDANMSHLVFLFNERFDYPPGSFALYLTLVWAQPGTENISVSYVSYIKVFTSPLMAIISNGHEREIAFQIREPVDGNFTFYKFKINGSESYDPDKPDQDKSDTKLKFKWFCRILSDQKIVNKSRLAKSKLQDQLPEECNNLKNYMALGEETSVLDLSTANFLENVTYSIQLKLEKNGRIATVYQNLTFVAGSPPTMEIR